MNAITISIKIGGTYKMSFIHDNFMLHNKRAQHLYHTYAKDLPIFDYHCHLDPREIAEDHAFENITELWLAGDHYKWRGMRANGIAEEKISGNASLEEKFQAWAETAEAAIGNPLFHWTQLELKRYFDIDECLTSKNWETIYHETNKQLKERSLTTQKLIKDSNVAFIGTTDTPLDSLEYHRKIAENDQFETVVAPSFRPDEWFDLKIESIKNMEKSNGKPIETYEDFRQVVEGRVDYFDEHNALISDHGMEELAYAEATTKEINHIFKKFRSGERVSQDEQAKWSTYLLIDLAEMYHERGWIMQIHFGAIRDNNTQLYKEIGANVGADSINDQSHLAKNLNKLLDAMNRNKALPKTILYNLNPEYNHIVASAAQNFQGNEEGIKGKIQFGAGWWFNDTEQGMLRQMETLADHGLLMHFVGMLTDSRSFISYPRHEYFRRILCNFIGEQVELGKFPNEESLLKQLVENICYYNAKRYFKK